MQPNLSTELCQISRRRVLGLIGIGAVFPLAGCLGDEDVPSRVLFFSDQEWDEDAIIWTLMPLEDETRTYVISYKVFEDQTELESVIDQSYQLSRQNPLVIEIPNPKMENVGYTLASRIVDEWDRHLGEGYECSAVGRGSCRIQDNYFE